MAKPVTFPYKSLDAAVKDDFKKIGGADKAYSYLVKGFKTAFWRKVSEASRKEKEAAEDAAAEIVLKEGRR